MEEKEGAVQEPAGQPSAKRFVSPDDIVKEKRQYIAAMNERERQKLLEQIATEEEEEKKEQERLENFRKERHKNSILFRLQDRLVKKIREPKSVKETDRKSTEEAGSINSETVSGDEERTVVAEEAHSLEEACARVRNDQYAFFYIEPVNMDFFLAKGDTGAVMECRRIIERCGQRIWQGHFYKYEETGAYCALIPDCRLNAKELKKMGDSLLFAIKEFTVNGKYQVRYGYASGRTGASMELIIREAVANCRKQS